MAEENIHIQLPTKRTTAIISWLAALAVGAGTGVYSGLSSDDDYAHQRTLAALEASIANIVLDLEDNREQHIFNDLRLQAIEANDTDCRQRTTRLEADLKDHITYGTQRGEDFARRLDRIETKNDAVNAAQDNLIERCMRRTQ